jgi:hypothetical protein
MQQAVRRGILVMQLRRGEEVEMNRLVKKLGKYNVAALIIMVVGVILFVLGPPLYEAYGFDTDIFGLPIFVIGLLMLVVGLIVRRVRSNFLKGLVVGSVATVAICFLIGVFGYLTWGTPDPPSVRTNDATEITANSATLNGDMTDLNDTVGADVSFQWGTSSESWPNETAAVLRGAGAFSFSLTGLTSNTTYYYRAKADSGNYGTRYGDERSFTTP